MSEQFANIALKAIVTKSLFLAKDQASPNY